MEIERNKQNAFVRVFNNKTALYNVIAIALFALISWLYFYPDAIEGNILKQHDVLQGIAIGQEGKAFTEETGETTRWTNSLFGGMPNFQISPSYESSKLISWLSKAYSLWLPSPVNLVFIMMLGFYILLLAFKVKWYIAIPGALAYAFSSYFFIIIGAGHIWKYITLAYIPPTIAGIVWCYRGKYFSGAAVAAFFAMLQIASNHVQMSYYFMFVIIAISIAFLVSAIKEKKSMSWVKSTIVLICAAILAVAANAPNLYNTYEYSKETMRGGHSELTKPGESVKTSSNGLNKDYITAWSYGVDETLSLIIPNVKGGASVKPEKGENKPMPLSAASKAKEMLNYHEIDGDVYQYLGQFPQYFGDQPGTNGPVYVGALIFVFFILGCIIVKGPMKWALLAATIFSIVLSWGHNFMMVTDWFIDYMPMYNKFRTVSSILVIAEFTMPLLAILAIQKLVSEKKFFEKYRNPLFISFGLTAFICILLWLMPQFLGSPYSVMERDAYITSGMAQQYPQLFAAVEAVRYQMVSSDALRSLFVVLLGFGVLVVLAMGYIKTKIACVILGAIVLGDLYLVNKRYLNTDSFLPAPLTQSEKIVPRLVDRQILMDTSMNYRVLDQSRFGDAMPSYFHKTIGGYHAAKLSRYQDLMDTYIVSENPNPAVIDMLNAKYVVMNDTLAQVNPYAMGNAWFVEGIEYTSTPDEEMTLLGKINPATHAVADKKFEAALGNSIPQKMPGDTIFETSYAPNKLTYHANTQNGALAVFSEIYFPWGWIATIDGKEVPIGRVNYVLRAMKIPAGSHTIEMRFDPQSVKVTETIAYIAILLIYALIVMTLVGVGKKKESDKIIIKE